MKICLRKKEGQELYHVTTLDCQPETLLTSRTCFAIPQSCVLVVVDLFKLLGCLYLPQSPLGQPLEADFGKLGFKIGQF